MDNQGFVVDEQLCVVGTAPGHHKECTAVYRSGRSLHPCVGSADSESSTTGVPIYGVLHKTSLKKLNMPTVNVEEAALLRLEDVEMKNVLLPFPNALRFNVGGYFEARVRTDRGDIMVAVQGDRSKPAILTYHDLGLNYLSFHSFFNYADMRALLQNFCVYHVNAPGQEEGARTIPYHYRYPTMEQLANQLNYVLVHFRLRSVIGFGVGLGANVLAMFGLSNPDKVDSLILINCSSTTAGWIEWMYQKVNQKLLRLHGMTQTINDYLMWHHFGRYSEVRSSDLVNVYRDFFNRRVNPTNLAMLLGSYMNRPDMGIERYHETLRMPVLNLTAANSPFINDTVILNGRLDPSISTWMKISDCGSVVDEQPKKLAEAFRLFLQGEGHVPPLSPTKMEGFPCDAVRHGCRTSPVIHITENPITDAMAC